jgi:hypothetical protein
MDVVVVLMMSTTSLHGETLDLNKAILAGRSSSVLWLVR